jgi:Ser/Thr protein kinase RdoA (MazF antagonist)
VLRDIWHDHVLFTNDKVTGIIDPSACRMESVACDLSRLIGSLVGDDVRLRHQAFEEYERHRTLTTGERALATVFDRTGVLLSGWTWLEWIYVERRPFHDRQAVTRRLTQVVERMEQLVNSS